MSEEIKTATQEILAKANQVFAITDDFGREIKIKQPSILAETQLIELLGKSADNTALLNYYAPLIYIVSIENLPFTIGTTRRELDAALSRLDRTGLKAVMLGVAEHFSSQNMSNEEEVKESIKKL